MFVDFDDRRRQLYGKAGAYRPKPYGMEYRVLSNVWLKNKSLQRWVYRNTMRAIKELQYGNLVFRWWDHLEYMINSGNRVEVARFLLNCDIPLAPRTSEVVKRYAAQE
jgi:hypothetical protein